MGNELHVYNYDKLVSDIGKVVNASREELPEGRTVEDFVNTVLPEFGFKADNDFVILWNDSAPRYNSAEELFRAVEMYFGISEVQFGDYVTTGSYNAEDIFAVLEIEPAPLEEREENE